MSIEERYPLNSVVAGEVIKQAQFGVFVKIEDGVEGLVHNSEIAPSDRRLLQEGKTLPFRVLSIDLDRRRLRLSPAPDSVADAESDQPVGEAPDSEPDVAPEPAADGEPAPDTEAPQP